MYVNMHICTTMVAGRHRHALIAGTIECVLLP